MWNRVPKIKIFDNDVIMEPRSFNFMSLEQLLYRFLTGIKIKILLIRVNSTSNNLNLETCLFNL